MSAGLPPDGVKINKLGDFGRHYPFGWFDIRVATRQPDTDPVLSLGGNPRNLADYRA